MTHAHGAGAGRAADRAEGETATRGPTSGDGVGGAAEHPEIDWIAAERSPEFQKLVRRRNAFVIPATIFFLAWYFGFIVLAGTRCSRTWATSTTRRRSASSTTSRGRRTRCG